MKNKFKELLLSLYLLFSYKMKKHLEILNIDLQIICKI